VVSPEDQSGNCSPKCQYLATNLHGITYPNPVYFISILYKIQSTTLHLPNRKDPHPATYKFTDAIDIPPNLA